MGQGDDTPATSGHLTPNPVVHMGPAALVMLVLVGMTWGAMPVNPSKFRHRWSHAWVAFAGPLSNLVLCAIAALLFALSETQGLPILSPHFFRMMAFINAFLFVFNMLPIPPFDGFTVASDFFPSLQGMRRNPQVGLFLLMVIFVVPAIGGTIALLARLITQTWIGVFSGWLA